MEKFKLILTLVFLVEGCLCFLVDRELESVKPFRLTYTPSHIVANVTKDVTILCEDDVFGVSRFEEISRIRMLKNSPAGWQLVAEFRDLEERPRKTLDVAVSAGIDLNIRNTFLEVTWDVALTETFGTYLCEIIGFDKDTHGSVIELTPEVAVAEDNVTTNDVIILLRDLKREVANIEARTKKNENSMSSTDGSYKDIKTQLGGHNDDIDSIKKDIGALHTKMSSLAKDVTSSTEKTNVLTNHTNSMDEGLKSLTTEVRQLGEKVKDLDRDNNAMNQTSTFLAKNVSNIEQDLTSFAGDVKALEKIVKFLTIEVSSLEKKVGNLSRETVDSQDLVQTGASTFQTFLMHFAKLTAWPEGKYAIPVLNQGCPLDVTFFGGRHMFLQVPVDGSTIRHLTFCESTREVKSKRPWPDGSYCVNQVVGMGCPPGLDQGFIDMSAANVGVHIFQGVAFTSDFGFCCKKTVPASVPMMMPTQSEFILYRHGGRCQEVQGMTVDGGILQPPIQTTTPMASVPRDGETPDVDIAGNSMLFHICAYKKA
ncbi:MACPF domain-containing protein 2 [Elysia marginata]|uniref:MACPF domain-containing protein 2 n=1 Tax=Elysia marginata TaxID=1093978 RepID=A0AAV4G5Q2_9GAST|nr:MACPF domain-containing protein 2 [Elysia marginata]